MIEEALYFALGFCVAGLVALSLAPAVWARALRLTRRRLELLTPMDAREAAADRDHVRAEAALTVRRAEQALAAERARRAQDLAELGRKAGAVAALEDDRADLAARLAAREADLARARADAVEAIGTQGAYAQMTFAAEGLRDRSDAARAATAKALDAMSALAESRRIAIAALETRAISDRVALNGADETGARLREALAARGREVEALADERMFLKEDLARVEASRQQLSQRHIALAERLTQLESELAAARDATRRAEAQAARAKEAADRAFARADETQANLDAAHDRLKEYGAIAQERERRLSDRLEDARAEAAALRGALDEARRARPFAPEREGDQDLRALIAQIGRAAAPVDAAPQSVGDAASPDSAAAPRSSRAARRQRRRGRQSAASDVTQPGAHHGGEAG